jgi:hypothetical protein
MARGGRAGRAGRPLGRRTCSGCASRSPWPGSTDPTTWSLARALRPTCIVYDCIDRWGAGVGDGASAAHDSELALLDSASLVFTAGPSLYEAQRHEHRQVYCLPCAVDAARFAPATLRQDSAQALQAASVQARSPVRAWATTA